MKENAGVSYNSIFEAYFPEGADGPAEAFSGSSAERDLYLRFLDMLLLLAVDRKDNHPLEVLDRVGVLFSDQDLALSLEPHEKKAFPEKNGIRRILNHIVERGRTTLEAGGEAPLTALFLSGFVNPPEALAVLMAFAGATSRKYERIYGVLQEEKDTGRGVSVGLCLDLASLYLSEEEADPAILLDGDSFANRILFSPPPPYGAISEMARVLSLRKPALLTLMGEYGKLGDLRYCATEETPAAGSVECHPELTKELTEVYAGMRGTGENGVIELAGEEGSGRCFLMRRLSAVTGETVLKVSMTALLSFDPARQEDMIRDIVLKASLENVIVYLTAFPETEEGKEGRHDKERILGMLGSYLKILFTGVNSPLSENFYRCGNDVDSVYRMSVPDADPGMQYALWKEAADAYSAEFSGEISLEEVVSKYSLNPGRIFEVMENIAAVSEVTDEGRLVIRKAVLEEQVRRICSVQFGEQAKRLKSPFTWEDLVVDEAGEKLLKSACDRVRFRTKVNEEYGFGKKLPYGRGLAIVLYGPPGTGKTMAAQVLARELGLEIYRIDLSRISSKYIGETEKNLGAVFDAAKNSNAILFFDEADSLFSKRTEVNSSNDKYANAETAYLLQKIEEYSGVSILATNNMQNFDVAFKRRMTYLIPIGIPDEETRRKLWEKAFPENAPLAEDVDFTVLAKAVELSGAAIKNSAVAAAYAAAAKNARITLMDIAEAVDRECTKTGRMGVKNDILQMQFQS